jgi:hypothetical protein
MSPNRRRHTAGTRRRDRVELAKAIAVAAGIVGVTALLVWLMRPGPSGVPATGGLMNRQPRSSWLVGSALVLAGAATWWILAGSRRARRHARVALPSTLGAIAVAAVVAGFLWPGGLVRHAVAPQPVPTTTSTTATTTATTATTTPITTGPATTGPATTGPATTGGAPTSTGGTVPTTTATTPANTPPT